MKQLQVPLVSNLNEGSSMEQVSGTLDCLDKHAIDIAPWPAFNYKPKAAFSIAHNGSCIFLKYYLEEQVIKATYYQTDDPVYKDNCVEFFVAFDDEDAYFNLEVNAVGTCKLNFGKDRSNRTVVPEPLVKTIRYLSAIQNAGNAVEWQMTLIIPAAIFLREDLTDLSGTRASANFYKCGDDLPTPHFLCWNNVDTPEPDFHVRKCFGNALFL